MAKNNSNLLIVIVVILVVLLFGSFGYGMMSSWNGGVLGMMSGSCGYGTGWILNIGILILIVLGIIWLYKNISNKK